VVLGRGGDDLICARRGNDRIAGGAGDDGIGGGGGGGDRLKGGSGDDRISGWAGDDAIRGGRGNDHLLGRGGNDTLHGNAGDDDLDGGPGIDRCFGGPGTNVLQDCEDGADQPPVAAGDSAKVVEDSRATAIDVLANDTDADGGPKSIASASDPANGAVVITGGGSGLTYAPDPNYCNDPPGGSPDTFTYTLNGGSSATVSVTVTCVDDAPIAVDDAATVGEGSGATAIVVLANDSNADGGPMTVASATDPANGTVVITGGGTGLTYQPDANYCNDQPGGTPDTFTYTLNGGSTATVSVTVTCVDDAPAAVNDSATVSQDAGATAIPVLANDTDVDGGPKAVVDRSIGAPKSPPKRAAAAESAADAAAPATPTEEPRSARLLRRVALRRTARGARAEVVLQRSANVARVEGRLVRRGRTIAVAAREVRDRRAVLRFRGVSELPAGEYALLLMLVDDAGLVTTRRRGVELR